MWANIGKSISLTFIISIGVSILSYLVSPLFSKSVGVAIGAIFVDLFSQFGRLRPDG